MNARKELNPLYDLQAGDVLLVDVAHLDRFETAIGDFMYPNMAAVQSQMFMGMLALRTALGLQDYGPPNGPIRFTVMEDPLTQLQEAREHQWKFSSRGGIPKQKLSKHPEVKESYFGLMADAALYPRGGTNRTLQVPIWYSRLGRRTRSYRRLDGSITTTNSSIRQNQGGASVQRVSAVPQIREEMLRPLPEDSRVFNLILQGAGVGLVLQNCTEPGHTKPSDNE